MAYSVISDSGFSFTSETFGFSRQELGPTILDVIYSDAYNLGVEINERIRDRTPEYWDRGGSLREDEVFVANENYRNTKEPVVNFYVQDVNQLSRWGRPYGRFIEGPGLGFYSPTIANPSHMYERVQTEDMGYIEDWFLARLEEGTQVLADLGGITG